MWLYQNKEIAFGFDDKLYQLILSKFFSNNEIALGLFDK